MANELIRYEAARAALAEARSIDEVKDIHNAAEAMRAYGRMAKDQGMIADATEIRLRAERRLGAMMAASVQHGGDRKSKVEIRPLIPTLKEAGIDKHLADRARQAAAFGEQEFESVVETVRETVMAAPRRAINSVTRQARRAAHETTLAGKIAALPDTRYGLIYADPLWRFETRSEKGMDRAADNHYPTMDLAAIKALAVPAAADCLLLLWATVPLLPQALEVMAAWGFAYRSALFWDKGRPGTGYWVRSEVEPLLIGLRGVVPLPDPAFPGLIQALRGDHSAKPDAVYALVEERFPRLPKLELFARQRRPGWDWWGTMENEDAP